MTSGMEWRGEFGAYLQSRREDAGLSLRALSEIVGVSPETIRQYELGRVPDADKLAKIALALNTSEFVLDDTRISFIRREQASASEEQQQLSLDFTTEYTTAKAVVRIRRGSISITLKGLSSKKAG